MRPFNGQYAISLPGARCNEIDGCPVGGNVLLLIQPTGETTIEAVTPEGRMPLVFDERRG